MKVVNTAEMKEIEAKALEVYGLEKSLMVENIGLRGADAIHQKIESNGHFEEITVLVGQGENGSDGLSIARHLALQGHSVRAMILFPENESSSLFKKQLSMAELYGVKISEVNKVDFIMTYFTQTQDRYFVIDAIIGLGLRLPLSNFLFEVINIVNEYADFVVSLDIPSGIMGENGELSGTAIVADATYAMAFPKTGHFINHGPTHSGEINVLPIGLPLCLESEGTKTLLNSTTLSAILKGRDKFAHKYNFGHTLVVGGSPGLTGAPLMAAKSALKTGTGLVTAITWEEGYMELVARNWPEIITGKIPCDEKGLEEEAKNLSRYQSVVIGPGLGRTEYARKLILKMAKEFTGPMVIDADAIRLLSLKEDRELLSSRKGVTVFTPHIGEFADFVGVTEKEVNEAPIRHVREFVEELNCSVVLKGPGTFMSFPDGELFINYFPNDGMASGGSGDVLAGIIGGLLAQYIPKEIDNSGSLTVDKSSLYGAICLGVYTHTLAGRFALEEEGAKSMTATTIINNLSKANKEIKESVEITEGS
jgi:ADP-dependent NAD(P)H-hydrate dehydratase / NAD(P)H-hydrate epimerase